jgi:hypothetical protein
MADLPANSFHPLARADWRAWLERHHATAAGVWVVSFKKATGKPAVGYECYPVALRPGLRTNAPPVRKRIVRAGFDRATPPYCRLNVSSAPPIAGGFTSLTRPSGPSTNVNSSGGSTPFVSVPRNVS